MWRGPACSCPDLLTECSPELPGAEISSNYSKIWKQNVHRIENRIYTCHNILLTFQTFCSFFPAAGCGGHDALLASRERDVGREKKMISNIQPSLSEIESQRAWKYPQPNKAPACSLLQAVRSDCSTAVSCGAQSISWYLNISDLGYPNTRKEIFPKQYCSKCNFRDIFMFEEITGRWS